MVDEKESAATPPKPKKYAVLTWGCQMNVDDSNQAAGLLEAEGMTATDDPTEADVVLLPPSNPVVSVGTILGVPGIGPALRTAPAPVVGVCPVIGGRAVRGMADQLLSGLGIEGTAAGIAEHYGARAAGGCLDGWLVADSDAAELTRIEAAGIAARAVPLLMRDLDATAAMARAVLDLAGQVRG